MSFYLPMKLQFFSDDPFDLDAEIAEFEKEWNESNPKDEEVPEDDKTPEDVQIEPEDVKKPEEVVETPEEKKEPESPPETKFDNEKQNKAFAEMRRQLEAEKKYADVVRKIAEQNGMDADKLLEQYQEQQLSRQAEEQNVPVDVLKRLQALEQENNEMKQQTMAEKFNAQVEATKNTYGLAENDIKEVIDFYHKNDIPPSTPFEQVYKLANMDKIIEQKIKESHQKELAEKKKRQESTALPNSDSASPQTDSEITDEFIEAKLKEFGIEI